MSICIATMAFKLASLCILLYFFDVTSAVIVTLFLFAFVDGIVQDACTHNQVISNVNLRNGSIKQG
jgi:hypothetical protein